MHEIICPHCGKAFKIDEAGYADILKQVRDSDFDKQLHARLELAEQDKRNAVELAQSTLANELQKDAAAKDAEIQNLKAKLDAGEVGHRRERRVDHGDGAEDGVGDVGDGGQPAESGVETQLAVLALRLEMAAVYLRLVAG